MAQLLDRQVIIEALQAMPREDRLAIQNSVKQHIKANKKQRVRKRKYECAITGVTIIADDNPELVFYIQKQGTPNANKLSMAAMVPGELVTRPRKNKPENNGNNDDQPSLTDAVAEVVAEVSEHDDDVIEHDDDTLDDDDEVDVLDDDEVEIDDDD